MAGKWVNWRKLCNISLKERPDDVVNILRSMGYMQLDSVNPTNAAVQRGFARVEVSNGKYRTIWDKLRYLSITRDLRRNEKRSNQSSISALATPNINLGTNR